jgi:hypothetical protein
MESIHRYAQLDDNAGARRAFCSAQMHRDPKVKEGWRAALPAFTIFCGSLEGRAALVPAQGRRMAGNREMQRDPSE